MRGSTMKRANAAPWIALLVVGAVGETAAFVFAVVFGVAAYGQTEPAERSRLWTSAGWWLFGSLAFTVVSGWSLFKLLHAVAKQAPNASVGAAP